jgi:hypothetical protein
LATSISLEFRPFNSFLVLAIVQLQYLLYEMFSFPSVIKTLIICMAIVLLACGHIFSLFVYTLFSFAVGLRSSQCEAIKSRVSRAAWEAIESRLSGADWEAIKSRLSGAYWEAIKSRLEVQAILV